MVQNYQLAGDKNLNILLLKIYLFFSADDGAQTRTK